MKKPMKKNPKLTVMTEEADHESVAAGMAKTIRDMYEDRDKKAVGALEHLISQLQVTVDKYRTANGVMSALQTVRAVVGEHCNMSLEEEIAMAKTVATNMARVTANMASKAGNLKPEELDQLCEGFYDPDFSQNDASVIEMVVELMVLQLCQNVGGDANDVVSFCMTADDEIDKAKKDLKEYCEKNGIDYYRLCNAEDKYPTCICSDCARDCKKDVIECDLFVNKHITDQVVVYDGDGYQLCRDCSHSCKDESKLVHDGESAFDVCERFDNVDRHE